MKILEHLCEKRSERFEFKETDEIAMYDLIHKAPASKTTGDDAISMDILKQIPSLTAKITSRMFNMMIKEKRFPRSLKTARIIALRKPGKCKRDPNLYRPISLLNPLEKILEEELKNQITKYFEEENIIPDQHHGGRGGGTQPQRLKQ